MKKLRLVSASILLIAFLIGSIGCSGGRTVPTAAPTPTTTATPTTAECNIVTEPDLPHPAADESAVSNGGLLYVTGGYGVSHEILSYCQIYNPGTGNWMQGAPMSIGRYGHIAVAYGNSNGSYIYVFGGVITYPGMATTASCERYDIINNKWANMTAMPKAIDLGINGVAYNGKIYLLYGNFSYVFDPTANNGLGNYTALSTPPEAKAWCTTGVVKVSGEDRIYYIGGGTHSGPGNNVMYYIPGNNSWVNHQTTAPYNGWGTVRENPVYDNKIYHALGQRVSGAEYISDVYCYDPEANTWTEMTDCATARDGIGGGFIGNQLYMVGGRNVSPGVGLDICESLTVSAVSPTPIPTLTPAPTPTPNWSISLTKPYFGIR